MDQLPEGNRPPDNRPSPERPGGHIRVNVSQPELLYQLAKEVVPPLPKVVLLF